MGQCRAVDRDIRAILAVGFVGRFFPTQVVGWRVR
jgi:hypothetical protein